MIDMEFLTKSLPLQIAIGGGYLGYLVAYVGIREHHRPTDIAFTTIAFGLIATMVAPLVSGWPVTLAIAVCICASLLAGLSWRAFGRGAVRWLLERAGVSYANDDTSIWTPIFADRKHSATQVLVAIDDGREFRCADTDLFANAPFKPFTVAPDGAVSMYVTHISSKDKSGKLLEREIANVRSEDWGDNLTIIPGNRIVQVDIRFKPLKS